MHIPATQWLQLGKHFPVPEQLPKEMCFALQRHVYCSKEFTGTRECRDNTICPLDSVLTLDQAVHLRICLPVLVLQASGIREASTRPRWNLGHSPDSFPRAFLFLSPRGGLGLRGVLASILVPRTSGQMAQVIRSWEPTLSGPVDLSWDWSVISRFE